MPIRDVLHTLVVVASGALLGVCVPLLIWVPDSEINRRIELIVVASLLTAYAAAVVMYSVRAIVLPVLVSAPKANADGRFLGLESRTNATLVVVLIAAGAGLVGGLTTWLDDIEWLKWRGSNGYRFISDDTFAKINAVCNGTTEEPPEWHEWPGSPSWKQMEVTNILNRWERHQHNDKVSNITTGILGIAAIVLGWIVVALLVLELVAIVIPARRKLWLERADGGIILRWKDGAIELPSDDEREQPSLPGGL